MLVSLGLSGDAAQWLAGLWDLTQALDDAQDGDKADAHAAARFALWEGALNPFYERNRAWLIPALRIQFLKWQAANDAEASGGADARSFMWRAGFYDVVALVCDLEGVQASPRAALDLYAEKFFDYATEFGNA